MAIVQEVWFEIHIVEYFAIEGNPDGIILITHWISAARRQINDAQPAVPQANRALRPNSFIIRPAMLQYSRHSSDYRFLGRLSVKMIQSGNTTH
jgi:hypothetical protein